MKYLIAGLTLFCCQSVIANEKYEGFYLGMELGGASLSVPQEYATSTFNNESPVVLGLRLGYKWSNNWIVELRGSSTSENFVIELTDHIKLSQSQYLLGYSFPVGERLDFVPMIGWSDWRLTADEGPLFNPGPEESEIIDTGENILIRVGLEYELKRAASISTYYTLSDFGAIQSTDIAIGAKWKF